jgi:hypothetical protein
MTQYAPQPCKAESLQIETINLVEGLLLQIYK